MAQKKTSKVAAPTDDELSKMFEGIGDDDSAAAAASTPQGDHKAAAAAATTTNDDENEDDPLAELKNLASAPRQLASRPGTPRAASSAATSVTGRGKPTPPSTTSGRSSEDKTTADDFQDPASKSVAAVSSGGSWWGGLSNLSALATSAIKQAEATVKEISSNEEALKWAEQARNNYGGALKGLGRCSLVSHQVSLALLLIAYQTAFAQEPSQPLPTSSTPLHLPSHNTNVSRFTSRTT